MNTKSKLLGYVYAVLIIAAMLMYKGQCNRADSAELRAAKAEATALRLGMIIEAERNKTKTWIKNYERVWKELDSLKKAKKGMEAEPN